MPRPKTILQSKFPYNISARSINKEWFQLPMPIVWNIFTEELFWTSKLYSLKVHSFVLMSNHFHLIARTPEANLSQCMHYFMRATSLRLTGAGNRINGTYGSRYYKTILQSHNSFLNAYKYNYLNPVTASITNKAEEYPYSTLHGLLGQSQLTPALLYDDTLFSSPMETLKWINSIPNNESLEAVRFALRKPYFKSKLSRFDKSPF